MKISILTTITNPDERQDRWIEALSCYSDLADEVVVVNGGNNLTIEQIKRIGNIKNTGWTKFVDLGWPDEWNWVELPKHLNAGREQCTGDWIIKLDIDQFFHEKDFQEIKKKLAEAPADCQISTFQKISLVYGQKYYQKGGQSIAFRNSHDIVIGKNLDKETDLCFAVKKTGTELVDGYELPIGRDLKVNRTGIQYWNYDYFFKTKEFTRKEFWRFSRAYHRYFGLWKFGDSEDASFNLFLSMQKARYEKAPYTYTLEDHPKYIREQVENLTKEQFGYNGWNLECNSWVTPSKAYE